MGAQVSQLKGIGTFNKTCKDLELNDTEKSHVDFTGFSLDEQKMRRLAESMRHNNTLQVRAMPLPFALLIIVLTFSSDAPSYHHRHAHMPRVPFAMVRGEFKPVRVLLKSTASGP